MVSLGDKVKDRISGFEGIATCRSEYMFGCVRVGVSPRGTHEGKPVESQWFDEDQLDVIEVSAIQRPASVDERRGGPMSAPPRRADPVR
jgi:hypothetical protein